MGLDGVIFRVLLFLQDLTPRDVTRFLGLSNSLLEVVCEQRQEIAGFAASLEGEQGGAVSSSRVGTLGGHTGLLGLVDRGGACFPSVCLWHDFAPVMILSPVVLLPRTQS